MGADNVADCLPCCPELSSSLVAAPQREQLIRHDGLISVVTATTVLVNPQAEHILAIDVSTLRVNDASPTTASCVPLF